MTLVEVPAEVPALTEVEAREITNDIRRTRGVLWTQIAKAFQGRAWIVLGYPSWDDYCDTEFPDGHVRLPREERSMIVASLADAGMSTRAIAAATGVSHMTVDRDLSAVTNVTPDDPDDEIVDAEVIGDPTPPEPRTVTGVDGKSYTLKPKSQVDRRPPLTDAATRAGLDLRKRVESLESLMEDDRFPAHRAALTPMLRSHLTYAIQACEQMLDHINT